MPQETRKKPKKITPRYLHNAGLAYLQKFAASRKGFEEILLRKVKRSCMHHADQDPESCRDMVRATAEKFERSGLLNDRLYAEGLVTSLRRGGKSKKAIALKLAHKGVERDLAAEMLKDFDAESELESAALFAKRKKLKSKDHQKSLAAFARAGFSYDVARKVLGSEN